MTTLSIHQRPTHLIATAATVAALAAGAFAWSVSDGSGQPSAPGDQAKISIQKDAPRTHHAHPTTSGGHVMLGF